MRKPLLLTGLSLLLFSTHLLYAQSLHWGNAFTPPWINGSINGNAHDLGGSGINGTISLSISGGSFGLADGNSGAQTPTVSGAVYSGPLTTPLLELASDFSNNQQSATFIVNFSSAVTAASFFIVDIDKKNPNNNKYLDRITVTGTNSAGTVIPMITKYDAVTDPDFLVITGNVATVNADGGKGGDAGSDFTDQRGTVLVSFGANLVNSITIKYDNAPGANNNPGSQSIGIGNIFFVPITLPVKLSAFSGRRNGNEVNLSWETRLESNTHSFIIERNTDGNWATAGTVAAQGNSTASVSYGFRDMPGNAPVIFYRLKQVDMDGKFEYSNIIRLSEKSMELKLLGYPNPFTRQINLSIHSHTEQVVQAKLVDLTGRVIRTDNKLLYAGNNNFTITGLDGVSRGVYYVTVKDSTGQLLGQTQVIKD